MSKPKEPKSAIPKKDELYIKIESLEKAKQTLEEEAGKLESKVEDLEKANKGN